METLLHLTVAGSFAVVALLLAQRCLGARVSGRVLRIAWLLVLVRLCLPFGTLLPSSLDGAVGTAVQQVSRQVVGSGASAAAATGGVAQGYFANLSLYAHLDAAACMWACGVAVGLLRLFVAQAKLARAVWAVPRAVDPVLDGLLSRRTFERRIRLVESPIADSPFTCGFIRPTIVVPPGFTARDERVRRVVYAHELVHVARCDSLCKQLANVAVCVHWFNPLVRIARTRLGESLELACDELVLERLGETARLTYARTLLDLASPSGSAGTTRAPGFSAALRHRVERLVTPVRTQAAACACIALLACATVLSPALVRLPSDSVTLVTTDRYTFAAPRFWAQYVEASVDDEGGAVVYPTGRPDLPLLTIAVVQSQDAASDSPGQPVVYLQQLDDGEVLQVQAVNYAGLYQDGWKTALAANPAYPGDDLASLSLALTAGLQVEEAEAGSSLADGPLLGLISSAVQVP
jgi:beta-lactamase regulating signal transducer with metallopeptidase domain